MQALRITIPQILWSEANGHASEVAAVPLLRHRIGPGTAASFEIVHGFMPLPRGLTAPLEGPIAGYLAHDLALPAPFSSGDLILMDRNESLRSIPAASSCWIVAESAGLRVRYGRRTQSGVEVASEPDFEGPSRYRQTIPFQGRNILSIVRARIVWIGREMETSPEGPPGPSGPGD